MKHIHFDRTPVRVLGVCMLLVLGVALQPRPLQGDLSKFRTPSHILSLFTLPGEAVTFDLSTYAGLTKTAVAQTTVTAAPELTVTTLPSGILSIQPPQTVGIYTVMLQESIPANLPQTKPYQVQVVVMRPASETSGGTLNGYPVGTYPHSQKDTRWRYEPPRGFVEITEHNRETPISDHFTLADLDCKLDAPYPHYASIHTSLLVKLEGLVDELNRRGMAGSSLRIMSGYRTPEYNRSIGNRTKYSRHVLGDAADVYIDANRDETMDDLTGDGRVTHRDALALYRVVEEMDNSAGYGPLVGGASAYKPNNSHGPFVHLDTRGYPARW